MRPSWACAIEMTESLCKSHKGGYQDTPNWARQSSDRRTTYRIAYASDAADDFLAGYTNAFQGNLLSQSVLLHHGIPEFHQLAIQRFGTFIQGGKHVTVRGVHIGSEGVCNVANSRDFGRGGRIAVTGIVRHHYLTSVGALTKLGQMCGRLAGSRRFRTQGHSSIGGDRVDGRRMRRLVPSGCG